jgi:2-polyprenyl-3-methyl-5-hydroxy-6-metoxy-1,4-benzoquinol methylase
MEVFLREALTKPEDWKDYYSSREFEHIEDHAVRKSIIDGFLTGKTGKVFELGCGGSPFLARAAFLGWEVGGIDFNSESLSLINNYLAAKGRDTSGLVNGDVFSFDISTLQGKYDLLFSFGFLEHFGDPCAILERWKKILKPGGMIVSVIPNLFSVNGRLLRKYDPEFWDQHYTYNTQDMDRFHTGAGLEPISKARFFGRYDIHMLIPWGKIAQAMNDMIVFKAVKYFVYYAVGYPLKLVPAGSRTISPVILGVYLVPVRPAR